MAPKIIALSTSVRSGGEKAKSVIHELVEGADNLEQLKTRAAAKTSLSNTDILCAAALLGVKNSHGRWEYTSPSDENICESAGILISSPVYFGDRSLFVKNFSHKAGSGGK